jgi:hypothetical protein
LWREIVTGVGEEKLVVVARQRRLHDDSKLGFYHTKRTGVWGGVHSPSG